MTKTYKKKLIEVAIPLEAINTASAREKSIRHGHPSTLHLWWARRPLAACRAVLFCQLVDDPSEYADELLANDKTRKAAEAELKAREKKREQDKANGKAIPLDEKPLSVEEIAVELERKRLFTIIEELVKWENSTNEEVLERARAEICRCCGNELPPVYDPFSGGGSIPLEAQRLGLPAYGSDLNPVAVMIGKAMIEIPPKFKDMPPIHPGARERNHYRNAEGLAEDVKYYGEWMRKRAMEKIGHLYPPVELPKEYGGGKATVIAWIWSRTVPSPDPAFSDAQVPIASGFLLCSKKGKETWIEPLVDRANKSISYVVRHGGTKAEVEKARSGTKSGRGSNFRCLLSDAAITMQHIRLAAQRGLMGQSLLAIVAESKSGRLYLSPNTIHEEAAIVAPPAWRPDTEISADRRAFTPPDYGMKLFGDLFTGRQLTALNEFKDLVPEAQAQIEKDADAGGIFSDGASLRDGGISSRAYAESVAVYLAFAVSRSANTLCTIARWTADREQTVTVFSRPAIPMTWDFPEVNPFGGAAGDYLVSISGVTKAISGFRASSKGTVIQSDAQTVNYPTGTVISTDPPYYDNIGYADLSDFFYCWLRPALRKIFPDVFGVIATPKSQELIAAPYRHDNKAQAEDFFLGGMRDAIRNMATQTSGRFPVSIYYAFKQSEIEKEGISSTGWSTFLQAILEAGYQVVGTWPMRTELANRMRATGSNALANSVVLVCRKKEAAAEIITRAEFIRALKRELPPAIAELQAANIAPADMPQSAIGPGMGVFSRYKAVLEADDSPMTVKTALQLINRELDEFLSDIQGEFDPDTRFAISWFEQHGTEKADYGAADNLARARGIAVESVKHAGIVESAAGKVRILKRAELLDDWDPNTDPHLTVWECCQYLIRALENDGEYAAAMLLKKMGADKAEAVKDLAYCLYDICSNKRKDAKEATSYNALIAVWTELTRQAAAIPDHEMTGNRQTAMNF
jgi:putative DNA methylase